MITISRVLEDRFAQTRQLFGEVIDDNGDEKGATLQSKAQDLLMLHKSSPLPHFSAARGLIDLGVVRNAYEFSIGTEDDCLMMVLDHERRSKNFMERALQHLASMREGDAQSISDAWQLLTKLSTQEVDNLTCAEQIAVMHFQPTGITPPGVRKFWERFRTAYSCFRECVEARLTTSLPILDMIANGETTAANWQEASVAWRKQYATRTLPVR